MHPDLIFLASALAALSLAAWWLSLRRRQPSGGEEVPTARGRQSPSRPCAESADTVIGWEPQVCRVLTTPERDAMQRLQRALPEHMVLAQVPLARFLKVPTRNSYAEWMRRVGAQCADLLVCDGQSRVLAVVELRQTLRADQAKLRRRHERMDKVLTAAGVPVFVWQTDDLPSVTRVRELFVQAAAQAIEGRHQGLSPSEVARRSSHLCRADHGQAPVGRSALREAHANPDFDPDPGLDPDTGADPSDLRRVSMWFEDQHTDAASLGGR